MRNRTSGVQLNLKTREAADGKHIEGYFAVFNSETELFKGWKEQVLPGAFASSIANNDIRALFNHDTGFVLGRMSSNTLTVREDEHGLYGDILVNENDPQALSVYARVQRGDISGCSFGFGDSVEDYREDADGTVHSTIRSADTFEISVCTFPAYPQTEIQARNTEYAEHKKNSFAARKRELQERMKKNVTD